MTYIERRDSKNLCAHNLLLFLRREIGDNQDGIERVEIDGGANLGFLIQLDVALPDILYLPDDERHGEATAQAGGEQDVGFVNLFALAEKAHDQPGVDVA